jgi:hypothetical protein
VPDPTCRPRSDRLSRFEPLSVSLRQGGLGGTVENRSPFGRIEDRAVAGAGELSVLVGHRAALVRAHGRVVHELAVLKAEPGGTLAT